MATPTVTTLKKTAFLKVVKCDARVIAKKKKVWYELRLATYRTLSNHRNIADVLNAQKGKATVENAPLPKKWKFASKAGALKALTIATMML